MPLGISKNVLLPDDLGAEVTSVFGSRSPSRRRTPGLEHCSFCRVGGCLFSLHGERTQGAKKRLPTELLDGPLGEVLPEARMAAELNLRSSDTGKELTFYILTTEGGGEERCAGGSAGLLLEPSG